MGVCRYWNGSFGLRAGVQLSEWEIREWELELHISQLLRTRLDY